MLFSLISLNSLYSLYSLLPGIVFDTCVCVGAFFLRVGYRFRYPCLRGCILLVCWVSFSIPVLAWVRSSCVMGIVFDPRVCVELPFVSLLLPFECRVSFSIPVFAWVHSSCVLGIVFDTCACVGAFHLRDGYRFRYPCLRGCILLVCRVSFSIPVLAWVCSTCVMGIVFDTYEYECSVGN